MTDHNEARRTFLKLTGVGVAALGVATATGGPAMAQNNMSWDKTFPESEAVDHQKVTFRNRYGIALSGDLYLPKDRADRCLPALAVAGPFGAVKEQSADTLPTAAPVTRTSGPGHVLSNPKARRPAA
ncbi:twin-arginine translocation signal domain-containing protein [Rhizobium sp. LjRoot254]|uniref:twin-arginine translocation signal domain-containing protein n=1 Tax=Rhizobium sp. LjRoot254 TaxID=3342297 RepID=UPI003F4F5489